MSTMGFDHRVDDYKAWGRVTVGPYLQTGRGWPGIAALLTFADVLIGRLASRHTAPRISVTADLGVRIIGDIADDPHLELNAVLVKSGRTTTVGEVEFRNRSGRLIAISVGTFVASPRPVDEAPEGFTDGFGLAVPAPSAPTLVEQVGLRMVTPGVAELNLRPDLFNATESLQGGLVALLGEMAAASAASEAHGGNQVVESIQVHYLAAARFGPFRAEALLQPTRKARFARVEVRDPGNRDRLVSLIQAVTRPEPGLPFESHLPFESGLIFESGLPAFPGPS